MTTDVDVPENCSNPRCRKPLRDDRLWLRYCDDTCAWGHKEKDDACDD